MDLRFVLAPRVSVFDERTRTRERFWRGSPRILRRISRGRTESTREVPRQTVYLEPESSRRSRGCGVAWYPTGFGSLRRLFKSAQPHSDHSEVTVHGGEGRQAHGGRVAPEG